MPEVKWTAPEYEYRPKEVAWFWLSIIAAVLILAVAIWQRNFLFGVFVVIAETLIIVWGSREPRRVNFSASDKGLTIDGAKFYAWSEIEDLNILEPEGSDWASANLRFKGRLRPRVRILIPRGGLEEIKKTLGRNAKMTAQEESFLDALERFLRF